MSTTALQPFVPASLAARHWTTSRLSATIPNSLNSTRALVLGAAGL